MVIKTAENRTARGRAMKNTATTEVRPRLRLRLCSPEDFIRWEWPRMAKDKPMDETERTAETSEAEKTSRNLPRTKSSREMGLERIVSMVPRSFSAAVRSMAGYMAPVRQSRMTA